MLFLPNRTCLKKGTAKRPVFFSNLLLLYCARKFDGDAISSQSGKNTNKEISEHVIFVKKANSNAAKCLR